MLQVDNYCFCDGLSHEKKKRSFDVQTEFLNNTTSQDIIDAFKKN